MSSPIGRSRGFTLLEVSFATGILFLTLVLLLGGLAHMAQVRDVGERKYLATVCLNHCLEQIESDPDGVLDAEALRPPDELPGEYEIDVVPTDTPGLARLRVHTRTTRGHAIAVSAVVAQGGVHHAP